MKVNYESRYNSNVLVIIHIEGREIKREFFLEDYYEDDKVVLDWILNELGFSSEGMGFRDEEELQKGIQNSVSIFEIFDYALTFQGKKPFTARLSQYLIDFYVWNK